MMSREMHEQTIEQVERMRAKITEARASTAKLATIYAGVTTAGANYMREQLRTVSNLLSDIDKLHLGMLEEKCMPPRTLAEEVRILNQADFFLERIALPNLKSLQEIIAMYGTQLEIR